MPSGDVIHEEDEQRFLKITSTALSQEQQNQITDPPDTHPRQTEVLAVHWHPESVPMALIDQRLKHLYPNCTNELIIPTQHNMLTSRQGYTGVEVDCYSRGFQRKVQLLLHFADEKRSKAGVLENALNHTFKYRSSQLFDYIRTIVKPVLPHIESAAQETGAEEELIFFVREHVRKIETLIDKYYTSLAPAMIKNKLIRNYFDCMRPEYGDKFINHLQFYIKAVKEKVKAKFPLEYFYRTSEIIEEARAIGAGIVIPHPEQFWPILLAEYDVDGYEVWNPQSLEYTKFLLQVVIDKNRRAGFSQRQILIFMGDDTHMDEKTRPGEEQDQVKSLREIGNQPLWQDPGIQKKLIVAGISRAQVIDDYRARLDG
nr:hypothetical protein [Desulfobulbaceae bacterium]